MNLKKENEFSKSSRRSESTYSADVLKPNFTETIFKNQKKEISEIIEKQKTKSEKGSFIETIDNKITK